MPIKIVICTQHKKNAAALLALALFLVSNSTHTLAGFGCEASKEGTKKKLEQLMTIGVQKKIWQNIVRAQTHTNGSSGSGGGNDGAAALCTVRDRNKNDPAALVDSHGIKRIDYFEPH